MPTEIHEGLTTYTRNPPPPTFSLDGILAAGRRRRRTRRLAGGGALTAVALGVALTVPSFLPTPIPYVAPPAPGPWSSCATASAPPTEPSARRVAWMSCYLAEAVPPLLPGDVLTRDPSGPAGIGPLQAHPARASDPVHPAGESPLDVSASAVVTGERGNGAIGFGLRPSTETATDAVRECTGPQCTVRTGPHGETAIVIDSITPGGLHEVTVRLYRGDTTTRASSSAGVLSIGPGSVGSPSGPRPGPCAFP